MNHLIISIILILILIGINTETFTEVTKSKVYLTCFAGRKGNLDILYEYIVKLVEKGLVDEVHMWDFTRDSKDSEYLISNKFNKHNSFSIKHVKNKDNWKEYYEYYAAKKFNDDDIIIKCDDDILFIDIDMFGDFIKRRREDTNSILAFPNIINNGVCAYYQSMYGFWDDIFKPFPYDTLNGMVVEDGNMGMKIHEAFVKNFDSFIKKARSLKTPKIFHKMGDRISINFFAILGKDLNIFSENIIDDEHELSVEITKRHKRQHYIDMSFVVVHGSFGPQIKNGMDDKKVQDMYMDILKK